MPAASWRILPMAKRMLIDATHPEETRVAVVDGRRLEEFDVEVASKKQLKGNIYLAKITRVEPSLQAAFVEYGGNRHGFLAFSEIHPDYYRIPVADPEALLAQERDLEEREDTIGSDIEMGDPRPGRGQRRSFRGEPRGDGNGNLSFPNDQGQPAQPELQAEPAADAPGAEVPGTGEQPPYDSSTPGEPLYLKPSAPPVTQPDSGDVPLDWFAPEESTSDELAQEDTAQEDGFQQDPLQQKGEPSDRNGEPEQSPDADGDDKPTTYQPASLPRDERSEPYEPSDGDAGQAEVSPVSTGPAHPSPAHPSYESTEYRSTEILAPEPESP